MSVSRASHQPVNGLYPIVRRVRRPLLPVEPAPAAPVVKPETRPQGDENKAAKTNSEENAQTSEQ